MFRPTRPSSGNGSLAVYVELKHTSVLMQYVTSFIHQTSLVWGVGPVIEISFY
jgi:hypothetical protein